MQAQSISGNTGIDTICRPIQEYKLILRDAKLYRYTDSLLKISEAQLAELKYNISLLTEKDAETKANYERQISNLEEQITLFKDQMQGYERLLKREKRKRFFTGVAGTLTTATAIFLLVTQK